jgi:N-glycosylase/DNA lyase
MQYYPCSYFRITAASTAIDRYIDPQAPLVVAVTGFDDREKLNLILMAKYIISYEPYNFKGHLTDFPLTLAYGKKIDDLRRRYKAYLWDAEFRDTQGANVEANGSCRYSVFLTKEGKRAVVVVNTETDKPLTAQVKMPNQGKLLAASPEKQEAWAVSGDIQVPARSAVVVMEQ